jgi:hypothetical protein
MINILPKSKALRLISYKVYLHVSTLGVIPQLTYSFNAGVLGRSRARAFLNSGKIICQTLYTICCVEEFSQLSFLLGNVGYVSIN